MNWLEERTVRYCYIGKNKENGMLHKGVKNQVGFSNVGDLKKSITHKWKNKYDGNPHEMFEFYEVDSENMTFTRVYK